MIPPSLEIFNIFSICVVLRGVSLGTIINLRLSLRATSATRVMEFDAYAFAIADRVFMEHGIITAPSNLNEPLFTDAVKSSFS